MAGLDTGIHSCVSHDGPEKYSSYSRTMCTLTNELFRSTLLRFCYVLRILFSLISENKAVGVMKAGHVFTIEPMICEGEKKGC